MSEENTTEGKSGSDILVVASKLKGYIREKSGMNTSAAVVDVLSNKLRQLCDEAIERAKSEGRKTVMDRDFG
jgi:histone H3/H4